MSRVYTGNIFIFIFSLAVLVSGCGHDQNSDSKGPNGGNRHALDDKLARVPVSQALTLSRSLGSCDLDAAIASIDPIASFSTHNANELWQSCQLFFACSPTATRVMQSWFHGNESFQIGFVDLKALSLSGSGEKAGLYWGGTSKIYIDVAIRGTPNVCQFILHELTHRFDPSAQQGAPESLAIEYAAYWNQHAFMQEILLSDNSLGDELWRIRYPHKYLGQRERYNVLRSSAVTRDGLLERVAKSYGFPVDHSVSARYSRLPIEEAPF